MQCSLYWFKPTGKLFLDPSEPNMFIVWEGASPYSPRPQLNRVRKKLLNNSGIKTLCRWEQLRHELSRFQQRTLFLSNDIKVFTMGKRSQKFSCEKLIHWGKTKLGTPSDCLNFPIHFLLDVGKPQLDGVTSTVFFLFLSFSLFYLEASPKKHSIQVWKPQLAASSQLLHMISAECISAQFDSVLKSIPSNLFFYFGLPWI